MAKYNYESLKTAQAERQESKGYQRVYHFALWDKKPTAIVRFDVGSPDDLEIVDVHNVKIIKDGKTTWRNVACLRSDKDAFDKCPLCKKNIKTRGKQVFVKLLEYVTNEHGQVVPRPAVWSRYASFADELVSKINLYGDLRDCLFQITREVTNNKTKFSVDLLPDKMGIYTEANGYVKDFSAFEDFVIGKHSYMERTFEELTEFVATGKMASRKPTEEQVEGEEVVEETQTTHTPAVEVDESIQDTTGMEDMPNVIREKVEVPGRVEVTTPTNVPTGSTAESRPEHVGKASVSPTVTPIRERTQEVSPTIVDNDNPTTVRRRRYNFSEDTPI